MVNGQCNRLLPCCSAPPVHIMQPMGCITVICLQPSQQRSSLPWRGCLRTAVHSFTTKCLPCNVCLGRVGAAFRSQSPGACSVFLHLFLQVTLFFPEATWIHSRGTSVRSQTARKVPARFKQRGTGSCRFVSALARLAWEWQFLLHWSCSVLEHGLESPTQCLSAHSKQGETAIGDNGW